MRFELYKDSGYVGDTTHNYGTSFPMLDDIWYRNNCLKLSDVWENQYSGTSLPDFDEVLIGFSVDWDGQAYFDNVMAYCPSSAASSAGYIRVGASGSTSGSVPVLNHLCVHSHVSTALVALTRQK